MKKFRKSVLMVMCIGMMAVFAACGTNDTTDGTVNDATNGTTDNMYNDDATGDGNGNAVDDVVDGVGDGVDDVVDGVEDGVDDLTDSPAETDTVNPDAVN